MDESTIIYTLTFIIMVVIPLISILAKDGTKLFRGVKKALADGKLTDEEIDLILADTGVVLRSLVRLIEKIFKI